MCNFVELSKICYFCTMKCRILVVEDDASFGMMIQTWLKKNGYEAVLASRYEQAKIEISNGGFDLILTDLRLPDGDGIILMTHVREKLKSKVPFIVMTGYAEVQTAVSAMKLGAFDYLKKPINPSVLEEKIAAALASTEEENTGDFLPSNKQWVRGTSPTMQRLYKHVELVAPTKFSVLILGESGTGKEYIARMIHDMSQNKEGPFIPVDCGSLSKELAPSELFGHLKGSFTSAIADNENLEQAIEEGRFRQDLFHRINEFAIEVPPLRDRLEDFDELTAFFIRQANEELGKNVKGISEDALHRMKEQRWNGNLRELRNVVRRCVLFAESENIELDDLPVFSPPNKKTLITTVEDDWALRPEHEKEQIEAALQKARGNKTVAAKLLQIDRKTLYNKMHLYGIEL